MCQISMFLYLTPTIFGATESKYILLSGCCADIMLAGVRRDSVMVIASVEGYTPIISPTASRRVQNTPLFYLLG